MVDRYAGANWFGRPEATEAIRLVEARGGQSYDIEEALCLLMQAKLSQAAGLTRGDYRVSDTFTEKSVKRDILMSLEKGWQDYLDTKGVDLIDFVLAKTIQATAGQR